MSLFSPDDLNAAFPEATPDALQDPSAATYEAMADAFVASEEAAGRLALTGGHHDAIGEILDNTDEEAHTPTTPEVSTPFQELVHTSLVNSLNLYTISNNTVNTSVDMTKLQEEAYQGTDWKKLEDSYGAYEQLGLQPEIVMSVEGMPLGFWQDLYSKLREWQDTFGSDPVHKLKSQTDGDGLYVNDEVANNWDSLAETNRPRWTISVIPGTSEPTILNVDHSGNDSSGAVPAEFVSVLNAQGSGIHSRVSTYPSMESYLTMQALRLKHNQEPVDSQTWSWLAGEFSVGKLLNKKQAAPIGYWNPGYGRVRLNWDRVGDRVDDLGVRPAVRGQDL